MEIETGIWNSLCIAVLLHVGNIFFFPAAEFLQDVSLDHQEMHGGNVSSPLNTSTLEKAQILKRLQISTLSSRHPSSFENIKIKSKFKR